MSVLGSEVALTVVLCERVLVGNLRWVWAYSRDTSLSCLRKAALGAPRGSVLSVLSVAAFVACGRTMIYRIRIQQEHGRGGQAQGHVMVASAQARSRTSHRKDRAYDSNIDAGMSRSGWHV